MTSASSPSVLVLGPLEARDADGAPIALGPPKQRALLALLALDVGRVVAADRIAFELWGDEGPASAANAIQVYVSRLRSALGADVIATRPPGYVLNLAPASVDAYRFEMSARTGRDLLDDGDPDAAHAISDALALWRGPAFADVLDVAACVMEANRLEELRVAAMEDEIEAGLSAGGHADVASRTAALVDAHPLRERLRGQHMLALYRSGRQAEALATMSDLRRLLDDELGVEPNDSLRRLEEAILRQSPELEWQPAAASTEVGPAANVPEPMTSFVGRDDDVDAVGALLGTSRLVTIIGPGGAGKTRLAVEVARRAKRAWFVPLDRLEDEASLAQHVARVLGVRAADTEGVVSVLREHEAVLVLDNCEHVLDASGHFVHDLLAACPRLRVLATSRGPLRIDGEQPHRLSPLPVPETDDDLLDNAAVRLFADRASTVSAGFDPVGHAQAIAEIVRRLDGIPLAIELAAARVDVLEPEQIAARLDDALDLLTTGTSDQPHHRTLRATLLWAVDRLPAAHREAFLKLSVFAGGFTVRQAEVVVGSSAVDDVAGLVMSALAEPVSTATTKRFRMLEVTRQLARELLDASGETADARRRHLAAVEQDVAGADQGAAPSLLNDEAENIHAALSFALDENADPAAGSRLVAKLATSWQLRGRLAEGRRWLETALDRSPDDPPATAIRLHLAMFCHLSGDIDGAERACKRVLDDARAASDDPLATRALLNLGNVAVARDDLPEARRLYSEAVAAARSAELAELETRALTNLATVARREGDIERGRAMSIEALDASRRLGDPVIEGTILLNLGEIERLRGEGAAARRALESALERSRVAGHVAGIAASLGALGNLAQDEGDLDEAERSVMESVEVARRMGNVGLVAAGMTNLGSISFDAGRFDEAIDRFKEARRHYDAISNKRGVSRACRGIADALRELGEHRRAARLLLTAISTAEDLTEAGLIASNIESAVKLAQAVGDTERLRDAAPGEVIAWLRAVADEPVVAGRLAATLEL